jgi:ribosome maturation factor RimP
LKQKRKNIDQDPPGQPLAHRKVAEAVCRIVEPLCTAAGFELVHCEFQREPSGATLRLYIDKPGGVGLGDCVAISRQASDLLDVGLDESIGPYNLEVSSPGIDRPLSRGVDFQRFAGHRVRIKVATGIEGRKNFSGLLKGIADGRVILEVDGATVALALEEIVRARLVAG